ncbi:MAG: orotidine-5'-phosphate decarboxylase [Nitriliruptoraceae bacterium]
MNPSDRIVVALDVETLQEAQRLARSLEGIVGWFKIGLELFSAHGPEAVHAIRASGPVFLDVKLHDIPTTVERAASRLADLDVGLLTIHASGGPDMVRAAVDGLADRGRVLAVTVLTSMSVPDRKAVGMATDEQHPARLAAMAVDAGAPGLVCAPGMLPAIRSAVGDGPLAVVPGIRPAGSTTDDHADPATPAATLRAGADLLVIGRPITRADDPVAAAVAIAQEMAGA